MTLTVFITGASAGFGAATARRFAKDGAKLILCARRTDRLESLKAELKGSKVHLLTLDVGKRENVLAAVDSLPAEFADIDILVNNAGSAQGLGPAQNASLDDWDQMIDTNVKGLVYCTRAVLPGMVKRGRGHIVNLGSIAGTYPYPGGNVYAGTKAFVHQFTLDTRSDLLGTGVRATVIEPGMCETEFSVVRFKGDEKRAADVYKGMKPLSAADIAECIYWVGTLPPHVNVNVLEVMPVQQAFGPFAVHRDS
ncbi:NAD(P)-dependent oxidoreductase [Alphaproteobacteria bacterium]|nr:NAD(P)-dependent oxidoreductase [Alphaproteobacteria bacterium]